MQEQNTPFLGRTIFRKSSYSQSEAACVEIADLDSVSAIRDTMHRDLGALFFGTDEWQAFLSTTRNSR